MSEHKKIGDRLKEWAVKNYGSVAELERNLQYKKNTLSQYVSGRNKPGNKLLNDLRIMKCDTQWLLTGQKNPILEIPHKDHTGIWSRLHRFAEMNNKTLLDIVKDNFNVSWEHLDDLFYFHENPNIGLLIGFANMKCNLNWLLTGKGEPSTPNMKVDYSYWNYPYQYDNKEISPRLKSILLTNFGNLAAASEVLEIDKNELRDILKGNKSLPIKSAHILEKHGITVNKILYGENEADSGSNVSNVAEIKPSYSSKEKFMYDGIEYPLNSVEIKKVLDSIMARLAIAERQKLEAESETLKILKDNVRLDKRCRELEAENQSLKNQQLQKDVIKKN